MPTRHFFKKVFQTLVPTTEAGCEWLEALPNGEIVAGEFKRPRNVKFHAKFFALLQLVYENQSHYQSVEDILLAFKYHCGMGHWVVCRDKKRFGHIVELWQPHSISFAKMGQDEFDEFYRKALDFVCEQVIPGMDDSELEKELRGFMDG